MSEQQQISFLAPDERSLLVKLIDTIATLADRIERRLPPTLRREHWQLAHHSPDPWHDLYWKYVSYLEPSDREALSLRATLADVDVKLRAALHQIGEHEKTEPPDLSLKRTRHVDA